MAAQCPNAVSWYNPVQRYSEPIINSIRGYRFGLHDHKNPTQIRLSCDVVISVRNYGPGIAAENLNCVSDPFFMTKLE